MSIGQFAKDAAALNVPVGAQGVAKVLAHSTGEAREQAQEAVRDLIGAGDILLDVNNLALGLTGTTVETVLATVNLPALEANDVLRIESLWSTPGGNANNKRIRMRLGGVSGPTFLDYILTTQLSFWDQRTIANRNSRSSQIGRSFAAAMGPSTGASMTSAIDTSVPTTLVFSGVLANAADNIVLERFMVELMRGRP